jgi:hypothetical protein
MFVNSSAPSAPVFLSSRSIQGRLLQYLIYRASAGTFEIQFYRVDPRPLISSAAASPRLHTRMPIKLSFPDPSFHGISYSKKGP